MSRSSLHKEKFGNSSKFAKDNSNDGTAARTRPFSFDEIILRRNKKQSESLKEELGRAGISNKDMVDRVTDPSEHRCVNHASEDSLKVCSEKREDKISTKEGKLLISKDKEDLDSEKKSKSSLTNNNTSNKVKVGKIDEQGHGKRKPDVRSGNSDDDYEKRHSRKLKVNDEFASKRRGNSERESRSKQQTENDGRWVHGKRKNELLRNDSGNESEKKHSRGSPGKFKYIDKHGGKYNKESGRKHRGEDDERTRHRNVGKKHNSENWHDAGFRERKERKESSQIRHGEPKSKRRRSRSRKQDKERARRSVSTSSKVHKWTSYDSREHALSSRSSKDGSGRPNSDIDQKKKSNNGSSSHSHPQGVSESGLGGYSPRKRRSEPDIKTISPTNPTLGKRSAGWDFPPSVTETNVAVYGSNLQSSNQTVSSDTHNFSNVIPVSAIMTKPVLGVLASASSLMMRTSLDTVQLTEANRPLRRLYVENLPASACEKAVMEYLNLFLVSSGSSRIQGTQPCISCIMHKEKGQALVEFLTPEDASAALSFDGRSFSGSILKIRRPKDFVEVVSGVHEKSAATVDSISDTVKDSPHKIFIGGISEVISPEMLKEIAGAFGPLKAYHFEVNANRNEPCAFLEYVDQSITLKACAGLNGIKLGGKVLTVVLAFPDASSLDNNRNQPFYGIPEHAKPLIEKPTHVLKLKNVLDPEGFSLMSELELEEILEDIRIECARFGTVKSAHVVKYSSCSTTLQTCEVIGNPVCTMDATKLECDNKKKGTEHLEKFECDKQVGSLDSPSTKKTEENEDSLEGSNCFDDRVGRSEPSDSDRLAEKDDKDIESFDDVGMPEDSCDTKNEDNEVTEGNSTVDDYLKHDMCNAASENLVLEHPTLGNISLESPEQTTTIDKVGCFGSEVLGNIQTDMDVPKRGEKREQVSWSDDIFELGCVLVEFRRPEGSCLAAHCLHGRLFDQRIVTVEYVDDDLYKARFFK